MVSDLPIERPPRVSVIMAVYNGAQYVGQAIESILGQTYTDFQMVIVDDGSCDETPHILASFQDDRIVIVRNAHNLGLTKALNRGIQASRGELIARQDADDLSLPNRLIRQVGYLDANPNVGLVGSGSRWIDGHNGTIREWYPMTDPIEIQQTLLASIPFLHGTFIFRRACLDHICNGYDESMPVAQDCDLLLRISERWELANLSNILYVHRRHQDTVTTRRKADQQRYHQLAQQAAVRRRLAYGWGRLGLTRAETPAWVQSADRRWLARRFIWWSAAARTLSKVLVMQFLLIALLLEPTTPEIWSYIRGIIGRKIDRLGKNSTRR